MGGTQPELLAFRLEAGAKVCGWLLKLGVASESLWQGHGRELSHKEKILPTPRASGEEHNPMNLPLWGLRAVGPAMTGEDPCLVCLFLLCGWIWLSGDHVPSAVPAHRAALRDWCTEQSPEQRLGTPSDAVTRSQAPFSRWRRLSHIPGLGQTADEVEGSRGQVAFMLGVSCVCLCLPCFLPLPLTVPHSVDKSFLHPSGVQRWQEL